MDIVKSLNYSTCLLFIFKMTPSTQSAYVMPLYLLCSCKRAI